MILVTGGTGFIGRALIRQLVEDGRTVRILIRPSPKSPALPVGVPVEAAITTFDDRRGLESAMAGVDTVYHLAGAERGGANANLLKVDIRGTRAVAAAAASAGVRRIFTVSHIGADRASAYPVLKAKAIAEEHVRRSGLAYTIVRSAPVFGPGDSFTSGIAEVGASFPFVFLIPGEGDTLVQPIWVEDLVTCLVWALDDDQTCNQTYEVGGPEYLPFRQVVELVLGRIGAARRIQEVRPPYLRGLTVFLETIFRRFPVSVFWLDYLATHRTGPLDTVPRVFGLIPTRFSQQLGYLDDFNWQREFLRTIFRRK